MAYIELNIMKIKRYKKRKHAILQVIISLLQLKGGDTIG